MDGCGLTSLRGLRLLPGIEDLSLRDNAIASLSDVSHLNKLRWGGWVGVCSWDCLRWECAAAQSVS